MTGLILPNQTNKAKIEQMCRRAGLLPEKRKPLRGFDLLIADGFSEPPHEAFRRFGIEKDEFEDGMFVTFWWVMKGEEKLFVANPIFFERDHDPWMDAASKKQARINRAIQTAEEFVERYRKGTRH